MTENETCPRACPDENQGQVRIGEVVVGLYSSHEDLPDYVVRAGTESTER
ncbi:MAG: hypothetical protein SCARUB_04202 [Candidatus Scalindua rubra]|uniref:Uncharacterized protein n=1 Tax=Candidatus Scalindua rubra TaxID=1872076 RepID=A0A1E3X4Y8_9BACT|nr:MAG: hypothetical protein SCARUB_04202 [Candidatus Scalindua rubra]